MEYILRRLKLKPPDDGDGDVLEYIIGAIIALVAVAAGYVKHVYF
jgi:hypothetical protein